MIALPAQIDKTGRVGGIGLFARDRSTAMVVECQFVHNDHAIGMHFVLCGLENYVYRP